MRIRGRVERGSSWRRIAALLAVTLPLVFAEARAVELVAGDYGAFGGGFATGPIDEAEESTLTPFVIAFTPRSAGLLRLGGGGTPDGVGGTLDFGVAKGDLLGLERLGLGRAVTTGAGERMMVGGGFEYDGIVFGGAYGRSLLLGRKADLVAAGVGYGAFSASFGYAWRDEADEEPLDVLMLNTDLLALPWLAFESDVAVGESGDDEPIAVGRIGIRLNF